WASRDAAINAPDGARLKPMLTICPKRALTLLVTAEDLRVAQGYVRCGRCSSVFNALARLTGERQEPECPQERPPTPPSGEPRPAKREQPPAGRPPEAAHPPPPQATHPPPPDATASPLELASAHQEGRAPQRAQDTPRPQATSAPDPDPDIEVEIGPEMLAS